MTKNPTNNSTKKSANNSKNNQASKSANNTNKNNTKKPQKKISGAAFTAPFLMLSVMIISFAGEFYVKRASAAGENVFLSLCLVQIIAFFAPALLYYQLKHRRLSTSMLISPMRISHGVFIVFASLLFFSGQLLLRYVMFRFLGISVPTASIVPTDGVPAIQPILACCVVPALCEEFFFRGIILSEYRGYGLVKAIIISSLFFAFIHFSFSGFLIYLYAGFMLAFLTAVCRSVFPAIILHLANNVLDLYAGNVLDNLATNSSDMYFFRFLIVLIFLVSLWRVFSRMQHIYLQYSEKPPKESLATSKNAPKGAFRSWTLLLPLGAFLIITAISG